MVFMKKFTIICCIMCGVLLINGCSEEGSVSFEQKSSVEVSTSSGVNYSSSYTETKSNNGLFVYKINDFNLLDGKMEFYISITNNGKRDTMLNEMTIKFKATDSTGKVISDGATHFTDISLNLPVGKEIYYTFVIEDPAYKQFNDSFSIDCSFEDVVINPDID